MSTLEARDLIIDIPGRADGVPLNLRVESGQVWGVLGPNGVGKTTLLHTLGGLRQPRQGQVLLNDADLHRTRRSHIARQIGLVFQERQDGFPATVMETALIGRHPYLSPWQMEGADDLRQAEAALAALDLSDMKHRLVSTLSGGERQRVALATVLAQSPALWLADEPTNHLDLHHQVAVMDLLHQRSQAGDGILLCLHDLNIAARWCDHLLLLFPNGEACWGRAADMLIPEALESLYGQSLTWATVDGAPVFVPAR